MRLLLWYCSRFGWKPTQKTIDSMADGNPGEVQNAVVAFVHIEPEDETRSQKVETKLIKNLKWLSAKWETKNLVLHSFTHLAEEKADVHFGRGFFDRVRARLTQSGFRVVETPYGHFNDLNLQAPGHPLARIFKQL